VGAYFTQNREMKKYRKDRITEAYTKLINVSSDSSNPRSQSIMRKQVAGMPLTSDEINWVEEQNQRWNNVHSNLLIYGSRNVIAALSQFYDCMLLPPQNQAVAYAALIEAMRADSDAESYPEFARHVDNILMSGPERRRMAVQQAAAIPGGPAAPLAQ